MEWAEAISRRPIILRAISQKRFRCRAWQAMCIFPLFIFRKDSVCYADILWRNM